jgi:hypothetical protein
MIDTAGDDVPHWNRWRQWHGERNNANGLQAQ